MLGPLHTDGTLRSRFECKYLVPAEQLPALRSYFSTFLALDRYAARTPGGRYVVSSLYLDSPRLQLYRDTIDGSKNRYKLRLRTYGDDPATPVFCEVKKRMNGIIYKRRAAVSRPVAAAYLDGDEFALEQENPQPDAAEFALLGRNVLARPTLRVRYFREAWESLGADPVRVTFDTELRYADSPDGELSAEQGDWRGTRLVDPILEIKFTNTFPAWLAQLARRFGLERRSIAKYVVCMNSARRTGTGMVRFHAG